jgi:hypothetical protein
MTGDPGDQRARKTGDAGDERVPEGPEVTEEPKT